jgi:methionyl aminopeptidase
VLREGDLVSVDCGAELEGWNGDAAFSAVVGGRDAARPEDLRLIDVTEDALWAGITALVVGGRLYAVGEAVEASIESAGAADGHEYGIIEEYVGHTIGRSMHEDPQIPNYAGGPNQRYKLKNGLVVAIEPMVNVGSAATRTLADGWTVVTADGKRSAHFEHTIAVTEHGPEVLTLPR